MKQLYKIRLVFIERFYMLNSVNGNVSNEVLIQKNELKNNRISYRGKATNSLEKFPAQECR